MVVISCWGVVYDRIDMFEPVQNLKFAGVFGVFYRVPSWVLVLSQTTLTID